jgi:hypothetical protein
MADNKSSELPDKVFTMNTISSFILIDLISQAAALQQYIRDWSKEELIAWMKEQGTLKPFNDIFGNEIFSFESPVGFSATFYIQEKRFIFLGDHTFFSF